MHGDLREEAIADVLRTLAGRDFTGVLSITAPGGGASVELVDGHLSRATSPVPAPRLGHRLLNGGLVDEGKLDEAYTVREAREDDDRLGALLVELGHATEQTIRLVLHEQVLEALFAIGRLRRGAYDASEEAEPSHRVTVRLPVDQALAELARRETEWASVRRTVGDLACVPEFVPGSRAEPGLEADEFAVLVRLDGRQSVAQLADATGLGAFETARVVHALALLGVVRVAPLADDDDDGGEDLAEAADGLARQAASEGWTAPPPRDVEARDDDSGDEPAPWQWDATPDESTSRSDDADADEVDPDRVEVISDAAGVDADDEASDDVEVVGDAASDDPAAVVDVADEGIVDDPPSEDDRTAEATPQDEELRDDREDLDDAPRVEVADVLAQLNDVMTAAPDDEPATDEDDGPDDTAPSVQPEPRPERAAARPSDRGDEPPTRRDRSELLRELSALSFGGGGGDGGGFFGR